MTGRPPETAEIEAMTAALHHRGPDGSGVLVEGPLALGHRRLSIIDIETGSQPMASVSGRTVISYNGEIFNYPALRNRLIEDGCRLRTQSDTEVILALYEKCGLDFVRHLSGMFGLALWDRQTQTLVLARDRIGVKPLFYAECDGRLYFASEIKAIREVSGGQVLSIGAVNAFFTRQYIGGRQTIFGGIDKVVPGSLLQVTRDGVRDSIYWRPNPDERRDLAPAVAAEQLDHLLQNAVREHLTSDVPVGLFLSGGVDSGLLLSYASEIGGPPQTFSVGFGEAAAVNETTFSRKLARSFGTDHHEIHVGEAELLDALEHIVTNLDQPLADYALPPTYLMSRFAASQVKVVLSGEGADELFGGYGRYHLYSALDAARVFGRSTSLMGMLPKAPLFRSSERASLLGDHHRDDGQLLSEQQMAADKKRFSAAGHLNSMLYTDLRNWLVDDLLTKVDAMGMLASLEARVPYLDYHLVEFVLSLSPALKVGLRSRKRVLKHVAAARLPATIVNRPKHGFTVPVDDWLRGPLKSRAEDLLLREDRREPGMRASYVRRLFDRHANGAPNLGLKLWSIFIFQWWREIHRC